MAMHASPLPPEGTKTICENHYALIHVHNNTDVSGDPKMLPSVLLSDEASLELPLELLPQGPPVYPPDPSSEGGEGGISRAALYRWLVSQAQAQGLVSLVQQLGDLVAQSEPVRRLMALPLTPYIGKYAASLGPALRGTMQFAWNVLRRFKADPTPRAIAGPLEWHPRQPWLAAADRWGRVQVVDLGPSLQATGRDSRGARPEVLVSGPGNLRAVLAHEALQHQALCVSWSPTSPGLLAVGSTGLVGLWAMAGEARPPLAAAGRVTGPWLRLLKTAVAGARVTSLSWSPDGRMLAAASMNQAGLQVWDVATGTYVCVGPAAFDLVRWSPCGNYVFAAGHGSRQFYIFDALKWWWQRWDIEAGAGGAAAVAAGANVATARATSQAASTTRVPSDVVAAAWAPSSASRVPILLLALSGCKADLLALHLVEEPPSLQAQVLPVALPELHRVERGARVAGADLVGGSGVNSGGLSDTRSVSSPSVVDMAWDQSGARLAVLLGPAEMRGPHSVVLYSTSLAPLVQADLIGLARPSERLCRSASAAASATGDAVAADKTAPLQGEAERASIGNTDPASLVALPGALKAARLAPFSTVGGSGASDRAPGPFCVISARVGERGIYNLPCFL
ncbi:hypothetical protein VaNZ11_006951 [Volvox africanus]|uniref:Anaphase-promoting complex subunit 4 WD40 domain-containing protein n=1 Tax=Volvox africanus TaxID=51714 RepID=A0ABQ5S2Y9_9CHLO|nr:hypothetical protein VaNZ11_006951 [Volvox africanus]